MIKHGVGEQKQPFKNLEIRGGRGHQNTPWNGNSKGVAVGLQKKPSMGEYGHFLQLYNVVHSILCLNLVLLIINHTIRPESGYEVASCCN